MGRHPTPDQRAEALAARQHGAITRPQALKCGLTPNQIKHRVDSGRWRVMVRGVYAASGAPETWQLWAMVACLAGPPGSVASHLTAAALLGVGRPPKDTHVTVPATASGRFKGAVVHHAPLPSADVCTVDGIPCSRPARTVVDCAALLTYEALCEMVDDVLCRSPHTPSEMRAAVARAGRGSGRKGLANLERALAVWTPGPRPGSRAEMRLVRQIEAWRLPLPERQVEILDGEGRFVARADLGYRDHSLVLEYYGQRHHGPRRQGHDAERLARIEASGVTVIVVDKDNLRSPDLRDRLTRCVGRRPSRGGRGCGAAGA
jgi:putative AbiEi antitoxin of type IV toxin-antitoxin system